MTSFLVASIAFVAVFGGALLGFFLQPRLPKHHLSSESEGLVKLGAGMIATLAALVLGLLVGAAKETLDTMNQEIMQVAVKAMILDRTLSDFGPGAEEARERLRASLSHGIGVIGGPAGPRQPGAASDGLPHGVHRTLGAIRTLHPDGEDQRWLQSRALDLAADIQDDTWLLVEQNENSLPTPFLVILIVWLSGIFASFSLFAPRNATVSIVMFLCAISVAASIFLIVEMDRPLGGVIHVSYAPLQDALQRMGPDGAR